MIFHVSCVFIPLCAVLFCATVDSAPEAEAGFGNLLVLQGSSSAFLTGEDLGVVSPSKVAQVQEDPNAVKNAALDVVRDILKRHFGFTGQESITPIATQPVRIDKQNNIHIRYKQRVDGLPLEGASISIHFDGRSGRVAALNGDFHSAKSLVDSSNAEALDCAVAMEIAWDEYQDEIQAGAGGHGAWKDECQLAVVQGRDGKPYYSYKRMYEFEPSRMEAHAAGVNQTAESLGEYRLDTLFAERSTGKLVAVHPQVMGARSMTTYNCHNLVPNLLTDCSIASTSPNKVNFGDPPLDAAHNNAVDVYDFYQLHFGRKGMDGNDLKIQTLAHYGVNYNNAVFTSNAGGVLFYGDGDGLMYDHWAQFDIGAFKSRSSNSLFRWKCAIPHHWVSLLVAGGNSCTRVFAWRYALHIGPDLLLRKRGSERSLLRHHGRGCRAPDQEQTRISCLVHWRRLGSSVRKRDPQHGVPTRIRPTRPLCRSS
jgi:Thermolysin metallopeptidase, catalytic domain/Fungalysin/Thermolysin Propeptide Motif